MHSNQRRLLVVVLGWVSACLCIVLGGCSQQGSSAAANTGVAIPARIVAARERVARGQVQASGSLMALDESTISAQVEGRAVRVWVDMGDTVREGEPLVTLEPTELQYEVDSQSAAVRQVRAQLGIGPGQPPPKDNSNIAFVQRAAADLQDAKQKYERAQLLYQSQVISREQVDEATTRYDNARAAYELALQQVEQLKAHLESSEAQRRLAEKKLADATIRAPFSGAVKQRLISPGEYLSVRAPVMVLVRTDRLRARLEVPEKWAAAVRAGSEVDLRVDAYPGEDFRGKVVRISPAVNAESRTFEVEALLANPQGRLKPGFYVQAALDTQTESKAVVIPGEALVYSFGTYKVYVVENGRVSERTVKPGEQFDGAEGLGVEILEGLRAGEQVAIAAPETPLTDGAEVISREAESRPEQKHSERRLGK